jgi:hypothetical protein
VRFSLCEAISTFIRCNAIDVAVPALVKVFRVSFVIHMSHERNMISGSK